MASSPIRNSSSSSGTVSRRLDRGMPKSCRCGRDTVMRTSKTPLNLGRIFLSCPLRTEGEKYHLFKWNDEAVVEEVEDLKEDVVDLKEYLGNFENEIKNFKTIVNGYEKEVMQYEKAVRECENGVAKCVGECQNLKHIMVGVGVLVVVGLYYSIF